MDSQWPELTKEELENTIFSSSNKKAPGPDRIGFLIIQKAYSTISQLFYQLYYKIIQLDFYSNCWKEAINIIIKKSNKENSSEPNLYRIISLLNCFNKISEKIIAEKLFF